MRTAGRIDPRQLLAEQHRIGAQFGPAGAHRRSAAHQRQQRLQDLECIVHRLIRGDRSHHRIDLAQTVVERDGLGAGERSCDDLLEQEARSSAPSMSAACWTPSRKFSALPTPCLKPSSATSLRISAFCVRHAFQKASSRSSKQATIGRISVPMTALPSCVTPALPPLEPRGQRARWAPPDCRSRSFPDRRHGAARRARLRGHVVANAERGPGKFGDRTHRQRSNCALACCVTEAKSPTDKRRGVGSSW